MIPALRSISALAEIGIVSGSDYNYIIEQAPDLIKISEVRYKLHLFPCNGTKYYRPPNYNNETHQKCFEVMINKNLN